MMFGEDFKSGVRNWLYPAEKQQGFWRAIGLFVLLFVGFQILQMALGFVIYKAGVIGGDTGSAFPKAVVIAMFPACLPIVFLCIYLAKFGLAHRKGSLPLNFPRLGFMGWPILLVGFVVLMGIAMNLIYWITGFDPKQDSGLVEQFMAEMAANPLLYSLTLPSVILAAPLTEEFLFRGVLFAGLSHTIVGRFGAVVITAVLWALAHAFGAPWVNVAAIFLMGLMLGALLLRFGSLWVTIACHTVWNTLTSLAIFAVSASS
jgi:uncharacterized protein